MRTRVLHKTFRRNPIRATAGRPCTRAVPPQRFSPDASRQDSHNTHARTAPHKQSLRKAHELGATSAQRWPASTLARINKVHAAEHTHFLDRRPQTSHPAGDQSILRQAHKSLSSPRDCFREARHNYACRLERRHPSLFLPTPPGVTLFLSSRPGVVIFSPHMLGKCSLWESSSLFQPASPVSSSLPIVEETAAQTNRERR